MVIDLIDKVRKAIDELDGEILKLLSKRKDLVMKVGKLKEGLSLPIFDKKREKEILDNILQKAKQLDLNTNSVSDIFGKIFQHSRNDQQKRIGNVKCDIKKIGLVGFGRFGKLIVKHLSGDFEFYVYNRSDKNREIKKMNAVPSSLKEACSRDLIILAVPISELENALKSIKNLLKKDSIVIDTCSVKEYPVKLMKDILPKDAQILGTHSMFGPDSASDSLEGRKIILCKIRIQDKIYSQIKRFLESKQLDVIEAAPEQHDREMAKSLVLTHFIGRALIDMKAAALEIDTRAYRDLIRILDTVKNDTWQLFEDMNKYNRHATKIRNEFMKSIRKVDSKLK